MILGTIIVINFYSYRFLIIIHYYDMYILEFYRLI